MIFFIFFLGFFFLLESRTINGAKFNSIGIKKFEGIPKIFLKGIQIMVLKTEPGIEPFF